MIDKKEIKCRFKRSVETYNDNAHVQKIIVGRLKNIVDTYVTGTPEKILEIGCGTGLLTNALKDNLSYRELYINDLVKEMCVRTAIANHIPSSHCLVGDIEELLLPGLFDLVASSSTFQWFVHPAATFRKLAVALSPEALLIFSTFGPYNLNEIRETAGGGLKYASQSEMYRLLEPYFEVLAFQEEHHKLEFDSPLDVLQHLKRTGVNASGASEIWTKGKIQQFADQYRTLFCVNGKYTLTYHPLYFVCRRKTVLSEL